MDEEQPKKYIRTLAGDIETLQKGGKPDLAPLAKPTPLETYTGDFSDQVKEKHASFATVLAAEQDTGPATIPHVAEQKISRKSLLYGIGGTILLVAGITGVYIAYRHYLSATAPVIPASTASAPIFVDEREQISGTGQALSQAVMQSVAHPLMSGTVRLLYLASTSSTSSPQATADTNILSALHTSAPDVLVRNINSRNSMAGVIHIGGMQSPFFILSVTAYGDTFAGMLSWESSMPRNLIVLFPPYPTAVQNTMATSSTNSLQAATKTVVPTALATFHDEVVSNHDVRVYRDAAGRSILVYGYWNQTTLIIARDPAAFSEIMQRIATSRAHP